jgi:hypothetical protein
LVILFFIKEGQLGERNISPELLSFACGYSAKLVVDFFNKIIEKCLLYYLKNYRCGSRITH